MGKNIPQKSNIYCIAIRNYLLQSIHIFNLADANIKDWTMNKYLFFIVWQIVFAVGIANAQSINILSLNNSLIDYNNQPMMFNEMVKMMGKDAQWNARTQLGRTLLYHYNDPVSRSLAMSGNWNYIILQEQSSLPKDYPEILMQSVMLWKRALLERSDDNVPTIILPMNWAYNDDWSHFKESSAKLKRSYRDVCREIPGIVICPIGLAYELLFDRKGAEVCSQLYTDNRHPSLKASYLASCMEYAVIFQESPLTITYVPQGLSETDALTMRELAESALSEWDKEMKTSR